MVIKKVLKSICALSFVGIILSGTALAATGTVTGSEVNIREKADSKSLEVSVAKKGEKVEVIGEEGNWYHVKFENVTGYMSKDYVDTDYTSEDTSTSSVTPELEAPPVENPEPEQPAPLPESPEPEQSSENEQEGQMTETGTIETSDYQENQIITFKQDSNLRYLPSFSSRTKATADKDSTYTVRQVLNNWVKVSNDTNNGWVLKVSIEGKMAESNVGTQSNPDAETQTPETNQVPSTETQSPETQLAPETTMQKRTGKVIVESAVIRKSPNGDRLDSLPEGTQVEILGEENDWYKIKTENYDSCYIAERLIKEN